MPVWKWKEKFSDVRECAVEADSEDEARAAMDAGDWLYEHTIDFYSDGLIEDLNGPHDD